MPVPKPVNAGAPQGSVLGTYIFNVGTDKLEEDCPAIEQDRLEISLQESDWAFLETESEMNRQSSTPVRNKAPRDLPSSPAGMTPVRGEQRIELLPRVRNPPPTRRIEPSWRHKRITVRKFVDDNLQAEKIQMKTGVTYDNNGELSKNIRATQSEHMFNHITRQAEKQGLQVNSKKTAILAVSGARSYTAKAHIYDTDNHRIDSSDKLKILGFMFNNLSLIHI